MSEHHKPDQSFDSIAEKFQNNIYGSTKGRLRHELWLHYMTRHINFSSQPAILDAGGGTGMMTAELLNMGCSVVLNDISKDTLDIARQNLQGMEKVTFLQREIQSITPDKQFDVVVCHAVLEWVNDPASVIEHLSGLVKPGGHLSLSFFNRDAKRFGNILYGNFDYVKADMQNRNTVRLNPSNALSPADVLSHIETLNCEIVQKAGVRCFHDFLREREHQSRYYDDLKDMEITYGDKEPYMWLGKYFYVLLKVPE